MMGTLVNHRGDVVSASTEEFEPPDHFFDLSM